MQNLESNEVKKNRRLSGTNSPAGLQRKTREAPLFRNHTQKWLTCKRFVSLKSHCLLFLRVCAIYALTTLVSDRTSFCPALLRNFRFQPASARQPLRTPTLIQKFSSSSSQLKWRLKKKTARCFLFDDGRKHGPRTGCDHAIVPEIPLQWRGKTKVPIHQTPSHHHGHPAVTSGRIDHFRLWTTSGFFILLKRPNIFLK